MGEREQITTLVKNAALDLLRARRAIGQERNTPLRFTDRDTLWGLDGRTGPMASMQGLRAVLGAAVVLEGSNDFWAQFESEVDSLQEEWRDTLTCFRTEGYLARDYDLSNGLLTILGRDDRERRDDLPVYVDTVSWALSTTVLFHHFAGVRKRICGRDIPASLSDANERELATSLELLLGLQRPDGGWSFGRNASQSHLYYTWSAIQALADFGDYIRGESEVELGLPSDDAMIARLPPALLSRVDSARINAAEFLSSRYLQSSLRDGLRREDLEDDVVKVRLLGGETRPRELTERVFAYADMYLLESLVLLGWDMGPNRQPIQQNRDKMHRLYLEIKDDRLPGLTDEEFHRADDLSTFCLKLTRSDRAARVSSAEFSVVDAGLWPQLLRTMILFEFYVGDQVEAQEHIVGRESNRPLSLLLNSRREQDEEIGQGLWDKSAFNLALSARAIEGLVDCMDYYALCERRAARRKQEQQHRAMSHHGADGSGDELARLLADHLRPLLETDARDRDTTPMEATVSQLSERVAALERRPSQRNLKDQVVGIVVEIVGDALEDLPPWGPDDKDSLVAEVLGRQRAEELHVQNPDAHRLLGLLIWAALGSSVKLFDLIMRDAMVQQVPEPERAEFYRQDHEAEIADQLRNRLKTALHELMKREQVSATQGKLRPSYRDLVQVRTESLPTKGAKVR